MAGEFPPNPEDGELYLPSDIAPDVGIRCHVPGGVQPVDDLGRKLAAFGLLEPPQSFPTSLEGFRPAEAGLGYGEFCAPAVRGFFDAGYGGYGAGTKPVNRFSPSYPVQVDGFRPGRAAVWKGQMGCGPNRSCSVRAGALTRESGVRGTGVFHPRVSDNDVKKKPNLKGGEKQKQDTLNATVGKHERPLQLPSNMGLPQHWTY